MYFISCIFIHVFYFANFSSLSRLSAFYQETLSNRLSGNFQETIRKHSAISQPRMPAYVPAPARIPKWLFLCVCQRSPEFPNRFSPRLCLASANSQMSDRVLYCAVRSAREFPNQLLRLCAPRGDDKGARRCDYLTEIEFGLLRASEGFNYRERRSIALVGGVFSNQGFPRPATLSVYRCFPPLSSLFATKFACPFWS